MELWCPKVSWTLDPGFPICLPQMAPLYTREPACGTTSQRSTTLCDVRPTAAPNVSMEGAFVLGVTNLDLLAALVVVDKLKNRSASKFDGLKAREKLIALLQSLGVGLSVPPGYADLAGFAAGNAWPDAAWTLTEMRHGYVHANPRRRKVVLSALNRATFEAWQLSLWYQELALLYLLDHSGEYQNRVTAESRGDVETVPWD